MLEAPVEVVQDAELDWIQQDDYNILWLPQEYRDGPSIFYKNILLLKQRSNQVNFKQLDYP